MQIIFSDIILMVFYLSSMQNFGFSVMGFVEIPLEGVCESLLY